MHYSHPYVRRVTGSETSDWAVRARIYLSVQTGPSRDEDRPTLKPSLAHTVFLMVSSVWKKGRGRRGVTRTYMCAVADPRRPGELTLHRDQISAASHQGKSLMLNTTNMYLSPGSIRRLVGGDLAAGTFFRHDFYTGQDPGPPITSPRPIWAKGRRDVSGSVFVLLLYMYHLTVTWDVGAAVSVR